MKPIFFLLTIVLIIGLVSYTEAQIDSTAFFMKFRQQLRKNSHKNPGQRSQIRGKRSAVIDCDGFMYFYEPCQAAYKN